MANFIDPQFSRLFVYPNINEDQIMTGQVMFRESATAAPGDVTGRTTHIIIGVVAIPKYFDIESHVQYPIASGLKQNTWSGVTINMSIHEGVKPDLEEGMSLAGLVMQPIWRT